jgi:hypothetical protein
MPDFEIRIRLTDTSPGYAEHVAWAVGKALDTYPHLQIRLDKPLLVNPPGSTVEQLPPEVLASRPARPYTSTACLDAGWYNVPDLHGRCRLNEKFTGQPCGCPCHEEAGGG